MPPFDPVPGSSALIYIDEFELTQQSSGAELNVELNELSYNIMGQAAAQKEVTTPQFSIPHHGYYTGRGASGDMGYFEDTIQKRLGTTTPVTVTLLVGSVAYTLIGTWGSQMTIDAPVDGLITIDGMWASPDSVVRGAAVPSKSFTSGENGPFMDLGAASIANGVVFHVSGFTGVGVVTAKIQTASASGGTYTDWLTTTFDAPGAKLVTGALNPNRYARVLISWTGVTGPVTAFASIKYA